MGYGNVLRGDDGVGLVIADLLGAHRIEGLDVRGVQQLQIEWVSVWVNYARVILADAAMDGPRVMLRRLPTRREKRPNARPARRDGVTHHITGGTLLELTRRLYGTGPEGYECRVRGESFEMGEGLSEVVRGAAEEAARQILELVARTSTAGGREQAGMEKPVRMTSI